MVIFNEKLISYNNLLLIIDTKKSESMFIGLSTMKLVILFALSIIFLHAYSVDAFLKNMDEFEAHLKDIGLYDECKPKFKIRLLEFWFALFMKLSIFLSKT